MILLVGLTVLVLVLAVAVLRLSRTNAPAVVRPSSSEEVRNGVKSPAKPSAADDSSRLKSGLKHDPLEKGKKVSGSKNKQFTGGDTGDKALREQAVVAWEKQIDDVIERTNVPVKDQARRVKEAFQKLAKDDQVECIHYGLNLLPDDRFAVLNDLLYDKNEDPEVLDAIFSDALNRPEEIKLPLLKALRKNREHPMFFEAARILDVIEPAETAP